MQTCRDACFQFFDNLNGLYVFGSHINLESISSQVKLHGLRFANFLGDGKLKWLVRICNDKKVCKMVVSPAGAGRPVNKLGHLSISPKNA